MYRTTLAFFIFFLVALAAPGYVAHAQRVLTVNSTEDLPDVNPSGTDCSTTNGKCSLRAALEESNFTAQVDTIRFNIPGTDANCTGGVCTIQPDSALPAITKTVILDGESQPGATCGSSFATRDLRIVLDGTNAGSLVVGLKVEFGSSTSIVNGLVIHSFDGNGIEASGADNLRITCNFIGTDVTGLVDSANGGHGVIFNGSSDNNLVGTDGDGIGDDAEGNLISGNNSWGIRLLAGSNGHTIAGNYIGLNSAGNAMLGNSSGGIVLRGGNNTVGTNADGTSDDLEANFIVGNGGNGIWLNHGGSTGNRVFGNYIGTDPTGTMNWGKGSNGVFVANTASNTFVGTDNDNSGDNKEGNTIEFNGQDGVRVASPSTGITVLWNQIFSNGSLGIDLDPVGATPNNSSDVDSGPNNLCRCR